MPPTPQDTQTMIDHLFARLDAAGSGGEITRFNHALRVQITRKRDAGLALGDREARLLQALGPIAPPRRRSPLLTVAVVVFLALAVCAIYGYLR